MGKQRNLTMTQLVLLAIAIFIGIALVVFFAEYRVREPET
jgi:hypothetical protein